MLKIGITGQNGFIGTHTYNFLGLYPEKFQRIEFKRSYFENSELLDEFVFNSDVIIHLAGLNRHNNPEVIYKTNIDITKKLIEALERTGSQAHVIFSSSTQEEMDNLYGSSKREARSLLSAWAKDKGGRFSGLIIPNVYGPYGDPYYNSVVATFSHQLTHGETPEVKADGELKLIYVSELVTEFIRIIIDGQFIEKHFVNHSVQITVSDLLEHLKKFKSTYFDLGAIPSLNSRFELNLFNTFRSYIDIQRYFPQKYVQHVDSRGSFAEIIRLEAGGQVSFSTTMPNITRGNHFHTRKVERFAIIKGNAIIQLRKVGTSEIIEFSISGDNPAYVDMPVWYAHNIKNIGTVDLYTIFWINEFYDPNDPDTYMEIV